VIAPWRLLARLRRAEQALRWIGTDYCESLWTRPGHKQQRCWDDNRTPDAEFTADKWCAGCLAAYGLGVDEPAVPVP
jgi:hypothetical protein